MVDPGGEVVSCERGIPVKSLTDEGRWQVEADVTRKGGLAKPPYSVQGGLMRSERKHGLSTEQFPVSAYVGSSKNLKDLKRRSNSRSTE